MLKSQAAIDRRALITGRVPGGNRVPAPPGGEIASILVQVRPERLADVEREILKLSGCEISGRDARGKLIVIADVSEAGALGATLNSITMLPHVLSASLVFHAIDAG
jgi:periplasmic nitrate reductase NapD